ncbi:hypothetical protein [Paraherbaspirillum soli]|uniref:Uncharacterized protein n=1 Tax=Paraherbaspirillum soli TaxID=631222 RepID=A0ABW0MGC6_9BURK
MPWEYSQRTGRPRRSAITAAALAAFLLIGVASLALARERPPSREAIRMISEIRTVGAAKVLARLHQSGTRHGWDWVVEQAATGNQEWLTVIYHLRDATDAGDTQALNVALAYALPKNPAGVLKLLGSDFPVEKICRTPFSEPDAVTLKQYVDKAQQALRGETSEKLLFNRDKCLAQLNVT